MANSDTNRSFFSLQLQPRHVFLPMTLALVFVLRWKFALPWWGLALILSALPVYYFVLPKIAERKMRAFEREVLRLLQQGRRQELLRAYRRERLLRLLAPAGQLQKQLGFIYTEIGDFERARACYSRAALQARAGERLAILLGLGNARYRSGDYEGAEAVYRDLLRRGQQMPEVFLGLAHSLVLQGRDLGEALKLAKRAVSLALEGPVAAAARLTLAEVLLARGKPGKARRQLDEVRVPAGDRWLEARQNWVLALMAINDGDRSEAVDHLDEVQDLDVGGGLADLARKRQAELEGSEDTDEEVRWAG